MARKRQQTARRSRQRGSRAAVVPATHESASSGASHVSTPLPRVAPAASPARDLTAPFTGGLQDVILELAGVEHADLRQTLSLWQREQDRVLNRAWRRPGGLARPAGL